MTGSMGSEAEQSRIRQNWMTDMPGATAPDERERRPVHDRMASAHQGYRRLSSSPAAPGAQQGPRRRARTRLASWPWVNRPTTAPRLPASASRPAITATPTPTARAASAFLRIKTAKSTPSGPVTNGRRPGGAQLQPRRPSPTRRLGGVVAAVDPAALPHVAEHGGAALVTRTDLADEPADRGGAATAPAPATGTGARRGTVERRRRRFRRRPGRSARRLPRRTAKKEPKGAES